MSAPPDNATPRAQLPLFPLQSVLFPGGLLGLKVFEARYLDLVSACLREGTPFGVVCLLQGRQVQCRGGRRFSISTPQQRDDGLWLADAQIWPTEASVPVPPELLPSREALSRAIASLDAQGHAPFVKPHRLDDAGWVANRWCELLPISLAAKHKLMALDEPALRLKLVDEFLRSKGVV
ncbi:MAG: peptidase S16 [Burkholderiales bacterium PBB5]|nr:MAG: peptidase S16 [Burkholderiales bacterium PBB5]